MRRNPELEAVKASNTEQNEKNETSGNLVFATVCQQVPNIGNFVYSGPNFASQVKGAAKYKSGGMYILVFYQRDLALTHIGM